MEHEVPPGVQLQRVGPVESQPDAPRVGARGDDEIVFELLLVAVIDEVDTGVDAALRDAGERGDVGPPARRVTAEEVVSQARQPVQPGGPGRGIGPDEPHPQGGPRGGFRTGRGGPLQAQYGGGGGQEQLVARPAQEVGPAVGLARIDLEAQRELAVGVDEVALAAEQTTVLQRLDRRLVSHHSVPGRRACLRSRPLSPGAAAMGGTFPVHGPGSVGKLRTVLAWDGQTVKMFFKKRVYRNPGRGEGLLTVGRRSTTSSPSNEADRGRPRAWPSEAE